MRLLQAAQPLKLSGLSMVLKIFKSLSQEFKSLRIFSVYVFVHESFLHVFRPLDPNEVKLITDVMQDLHGSFKVRACSSASARVTCVAYACGKALISCPYALESEAARHAGCIQQWRACSCMKPVFQARK